MAYRSANSGSTTSADSINVSAPSGLSTDDVVVVSCSQDTNGGTITLPTGVTHFTGSPSTIGSGDSQRFAAGYKAETGTPPASYTFSTTGSQAKSCGVMAFSGTDTSDPIDAQSLNTDTTSEASPKTIDLTAITVGGDSYDVLAYYAVDWDSTNAETHAPPSGWTERIDIHSGGFAGLGAATTTLNSGDTGALTAQGTCASSSGGAFGLLVSLKPASGGSSAAASSDGSATATASGASSATSAFSSAGESTAIAVGASAATSDAFSAGESTATAEGSALSESVMFGEGSSDAQAVGESVSESAGDGFSAGESSAEAIGNSIASADMSSDGESEATAVGSEDDGDENTDSKWAWRYIQRTYPQERRKKLIEEHNADFIRMVELALPHLVSSSRH